MNIADQIRENRTRFDREIERLRADKDITPAARARKMRDLHAKATERHQALITEERRTAEADSQALYKAAFAPTFKNPSPDETTVLMTQMSYRQALQIAAATETPEHLRDLRQRARVVGDKLLEKATTVLAFERGDRLILQEAAAVDSNVRAVVEGNLGDGKREQFTDTILLSVMAPQLPDEVKLDPALRAA